MTKPPTSADLYARVGGVSGISRIVDDFYDRVVADPELHRFFVHASMDRLRSMQTEFFAVAFGGPLTYSGLTLSEAHGHLVIRRTDYSRFAGHLVDTLEELGYAEELVQAVVSRLSLYVDEIVGGQGEDG